MLASVPVCSLFSVSQDSVRITFKEKVDQKAKLLRQSEELLNLVLEFQKKLPFIENQLAKANLADSLKYLPLALKTLEERRVG